MPDFQASMDVGRYVFWANTVPYKPIGNKAWSMKVVKAVHPYMTHVLVHRWAGRDILTLGRNAFFWFGHFQSREQRNRLKAFWENPNRFTETFETELCSENGVSATFHIHPLPHPSPLNATWFKRFPGLLDARLRALGFHRDSWKTHQPRVEHLDITKPPVT